MAPRLVSSWKVRAEAGEPFAVIRVRDLQGTIQAGTDAWGRKNKTQPVLISAELSMASPFDAASSSDRVSDDTVHYGLLAKAIISSLDGINNNNNNNSNNSNTDNSTKSRPASHINLMEAVDRIWADVTGFYPNGQQIDQERGAAGFLRDRISTVRYMSLSVALPKASLLGSAVSLSTSAIFSPKGESSPIVAWSSCFRLHQLRIPTLIGVNDNERLAKQVIVADVEIERFVHSQDIHVGIESIVVKTLGDSSFETLEALGPAITSSIRRDIVGIVAADASEPSEWVIKVAMEKPTAITMAAASRVEYRELPKAIPQ